MSPSDTKSSFSGRVIDILVVLNFLVIGILVGYLIRPMLDSSASDTPVPPPSSTMALKGVSACDEAIKAANDKGRIDTISSALAGTYAGYFETWSIQDKKKMFRGMNLPSEVACLLGKQYDDRLDYQDGARLTFGYTDKLVKAGDALDFNKIRFLIFPVDMVGTKPGLMTSAVDIISIRPEEGWHLPCPDYCF